MPLPPERREEHVEHSLQEAKPSDDKDHLNRARLRLDEARKIDEMLTSLQSQRIIDTQRIEELENQLVCLAAQSSRYVNNVN